MTKTKTSPTPQQQQQQPKQHQQPQTHQNQQDHSQNQQDHSHASESSNSEDLRSKGASSISSESRRSSFSSEQLKFTSTSILSPISDVEYVDYSNKSGDHNYTFSLPIRLDLSDECESDIDIQLAQSSPYSCQHTSLERDYDADIIEIDVNEFEA